MRRNALGPTVVYVGNFVTVRAKTSRRLPSWNTAAANRIRRLCSAIATSGRQVVVLSSSTAMRMRRGARLFCPHFVEESKGLAVVHSPAVGMPYVGALLEPWFVAWQLAGMFRRKRVEAVIIYCYYPANILTAIIARYIYRVPVVLDMEDVSMPRLCDWRSGSIVLPLHQLVGWGCLRMALALSRGVIVPTSRFLKYVGRGPIEVITGCLPVPSQLPPRENEGETEAELRVLFSGKIEMEHGIDVLMDALRRLDAEPRRDGLRIVCDICGHGPEVEWARQQAYKFSNVKVEVHGFVSDDVYAVLLRRALVCVVLQKPDGRFASFKTPSKGYEYLGNGKATIVTAIGDFASLPTEVRILLNPCTGIELARVLRNLTLSELHNFGHSAHSYAMENWGLHENGRRIVGLFGAQALVEG